jgi:hypothetical protein
MDPLSGISLNRESELAGREHIRAAYALDRRDDIEDFQREVGIFTRIKERAKDPEVKAVLTGLIMDLLTLIHEYLEETRN